MLLTLLIIQTLALASLAYLALSGRLRGPQGAPGERGPKGEKGERLNDAPQARGDLAQILIRRGSSWHHHGWAQADSEACRDALQRPGFAIRRHGEVAIEFGNQ